MSGVPALPFQCFASTPRHSKPCHISVVAFEGSSVFFYHEDDDDLEEYSLPGYQPAAIWLNFAHDMGIQL